MSTLIILYADSLSAHMYDKCFGSDSAFTLSLKWAEKTASGHDGKTVIFAGQDTEILKQQKAGQNAEILSREKWTLYELFHEMAAQAEINGAENIVFAFADQPFLNSELTDQVFSTHSEFNGEYTFADGYINGMSPEMLTKSTAAVLAELCKSKKEGSRTVTRTSVFDFIKTDINSFEVETVIGPEDFRMFRINLNASNKQDLLSCQALYSQNLQNKSALEIARTAVNTPGCLKTVPGYYNIQICGKSNLTRKYEPDLKEINQNQEMDFEKFAGLVRRIADFSENAVISLSLWGECLLHSKITDFVEEVLKYKGLSVLIETDGYAVTDSLCGKLQAACAMSEPRTNGYDKIIWIVRVDSATKETFAKINGNEEGYEKASAAAGIISKYFSESVYPQITRMNDNEGELEAFWRFWSNPENPSKGKIIVQKYDTFCGILTDLKPADLAPLERNPCWHLRRDMNILADGSVPKCREMLNKNIIGNVFSEELENIFRKSDEEVCSHMKGSYCSSCGKCDEYYTFNF